MLRSTAAPLRRARPRCATGLTNLGAREYNPAQPGFISPDPILNPDTPRDLDPYDYAYNNPATREDPTGQSVNTYQACVTGDPNCGGGTYDNAHFMSYGGWSDFAGGLINAAYGVVQSAITGAAIAAGGLPAAKAISGAR